MNGRLSRFGLRSALVRGDDGKAFVFLVENGREDEFQKYLNIERLWVVSWLDSDSQLDAIEQVTSQKRD